MYPGKIIIVLVDGVGDVNVEGESAGSGLGGGKTPLQYAHTPTMNALAAGGVSGLLDPVDTGIACGTDTAHLSLLGYDPRKVYRGRGGFEALGSGIDVKKGDLAFKSNFACIDDESGIVVARRADREFDREGPILCDVLDGMKIPQYPQYEVHVKYATEHRCGVLLRGPDLSDAISGTDPLVDSLPLIHCEPTEIHNIDAQHTSNVVNALSDSIRSILSDHDINKTRKANGKLPANLVLLRGAGSRLQVPSFSEVHPGLKSVLIAPTAIVKGIGISLGMSILHPDGATGDYHTNLMAKCDAMYGALCNDEVDNDDQYNFGFLHIKAIDDAGHDGDYKTKVRFIEETDKMLSILCKRMRKWADCCESSSSSSSNRPVTIAIFGDHSTPVTFGDHSTEPVPFCMCALEGTRCLLPCDDDLDISKYRFIPASSQLSSVSLGDIDPSSASSCRDNSFQRIPIDNVVEYNEISCGAGGLGRFPGSQVMPLLKMVQSNNNRIR